VDTDRHGEKTVFVREYLRYRFDMWETVASHYRRIEYSVCRCYCQC
jgi:hypothetical protein